MSNQIKDTLLNLFQSNSIEISDLLSHRTDLSTFIVHLTKKCNGNTASQNLESIIKSWKIEARSVLGFDQKFLQQKNVKVVSFTETPLEYLYILTEKIRGRQCEFEPYGIALTKKLARRNSINPVWYIDMTPGQDWILKNALDKLIAEQNPAVQEALSSLLPFFEHMGDWRNNGKGKCKEFWWEREWRKVGDFSMPFHLIGLCPENEIERFQQLALDKKRPIHFIDPRWGLEKIIAHMAEFTSDEIDLL